MNISPTLNLIIKLQIK